MFYVENWFKFETKQITRIPNIFIIRFNIPFFCCNFSRSSLFVSFIPLRPRISGNRLPILYHYLVSFVSYPCESMHIVGNISLSASSESIYQSKFFRSRVNSTRHHPHRMSSRRNKENGSSSSSFRKSRTSSRKQKPSKDNPNCNSKEENILKTNHSNPMDRNLRDETHTVSFSETPIVVKVTNDLNESYSPFVGERDRTT